MKPITREEYYLAKIAGTWQGKTPEPVTIEEYYLATMAGDYSGNTPQPVTRLQYYMAKAAGVWGGSIPAPVTRLEYYWAAIAGKEGHIPDPVTRQEYLLYAISQSNNDVINTVFGATIIINDAAEGRPFRGLRVFGKSTQDGTPTPEAPIPIVSAGEDGSIEVKVTGKNLLTGRLYYTDYSMGVGFIKNENEVSLPYAPKSETPGIGYVIPCAPEKHYAFSVTNPNENAVVAISEYKTLEDAKNKENAIGFVVPSSASPYKSVYTSKGNGVLVCWIAGKWTDGKTTIHECTESELLQLEIGSEATTYEPPRIPQSLTLATPNGLPGVSVSKDGNYTDADGQQWVCDEIDLERGKYVQRVAIEKNNGGWELKPSSDTPGRFFQYNKLTNIFSIALKKSLCNIASFTSWGAPVNDKYAFALSGHGIYFSPPKGAEITAEELNAKLNSLSFPVVFVGELATPIERNLTPEEIAAYKALRTYGPTTVITNDAGAGMEVAYVVER